MKEIYLDAMSTTPLNSRVVKAMEKAFSYYGNPGSLNGKGEEVKDLVEKARKKIASKIGAKAEEIIFTSGGTEANNLAIFGIARKHPWKKILISCVEHSSVYESCMALKKEGYNIIEIPVDKEGFIDFDFLQKEIKGAFLVSIIHGNNEFGTIQDISRIAKICKLNKVLFHTDAVQTFCKVPLDVRNIDLLSASAHKICGPKGIGFLYVKNGTNISPLIFGGKQEKGLRAGTENVPGILGFAEATELKYEGEKSFDELVEALEEIGGKLNGSRSNRIKENISISFPFDAESAVLNLSSKGIYCSTKSACVQSLMKENRVLENLGLSKKEVFGTIRLGLYRKLEKIEIVRIKNELKKLVNNIY